MPRLSAKPGSSARRAPRRAAPKSNRDANLVVKQTTGTPPLRLCEMVAHELAQPILDGAYTIGDRLPSGRDLAAQFCVSRPTIREALISPEVICLVEAKTGSGVYVRCNRRSASAPRRADAGMFELLEARRILESEAGALAAQRLQHE
jgi:GntR family transcriptional repressor for pyruvate dehydrogenase complex